MDMPNSYTLQNLHEELQIKIFSQGKIKTIGRLSLVSRQTCILTEKIWMSFCKLEDPRLVKPIGVLTWKQIYFDEVLELNKHLGPYPISISLCIDNNTPFKILSTKSLTVNINSESETFNTIHLKKIVKRQEKLKCDLGQMEITYNNVKLEDAMLINTIENPLKFRDKFSETYFDIKDYYIKEEESNFECTIQ